MTDDLSALAAQLSEAHREAVALWLRERALAEVPALQGVRGFLWALFHPIELGKIHGRLFALSEAADAIEQEQTNDE